MKPLELAALEAELASLFEAFPELKDDEDLRADMVEGSTEVFAIMSRVVRSMQQDNALVTSLKGYIGEMRDRAERFEARADGKRALLDRLMRMADLRKAVLPEATLSIRAVPPAVIITDESELPDAYFRIVRSVDKTAVKEALKAGEFVPGASLSNGTETISVRVS